MDWFPWYPERYKQKTLHLTAEQDGIYRRLIDHYMETRQPLPDSDFALARIAQVDQSCFKQASSIVRAFFKVGKDGFLHLETCDNELDKQDKQSKFYSDRAKRGAKARHSKDIENIDLPASSKQQAMLQPATITKTVTITKVSKDTNIIPDDVSEQVWSDFKTHRKAKKATITKTAIDGIRREATKAEITLEQAIVIMVNRGWTGFKAEWMNNGTGKSQTSGTISAIGSSSGEQNGNGYSGRKSQTELAAEITERIKRERLENWERNTGKPLPPEPTIGIAQADIHDVKKIR